MLARQKHDERAEHEEERPRNADDAPRRLVMDDAVTHKRADAIDRDVAQADLANHLAEQTGQQSERDRDFVTPNQHEPVMPRLLVAVAVAAGGEPRVKGLVESF